MPKILLLFVTALSTGVVLPLPEEAVLIGMSVTSDGENPALVALAAFLGLYIRDVILFLVGRLAGAALFRSRLARRFVGEAPLEGIQRRAEENAVMAVVAARMAFGVRTPAQVTLGAVGVPIATHLVVDALVLAIWVPLLIAFGTFFHGPATALLGWGGENRLLLMAFAVIIAFAWLTRRITDDDDVTPEGEP